MRSLLLALVALLSASLSAQAQCAKPSGPACALARVPFETDLAADNCRKEMLAYRDAMDSYAACRGQASKDDEAAAKDEYEAVRAGFNKRARGEFD
jgi:hypothetical protein